MDQYRGPATIVQEDRRADVECEYVVMQERPSGIPGLLSWRGSYVDAEVAAEPRTGEAELELDDGRTGKILVNHVSLGTGSGSFVGSGEPPRG